jgi:hypothetical protein
MSRCSSWSERSDVFGVTVSLHLIPRIGGLHRDALNLSGWASVSWLAPTVRYGVGKTSSFACGSLRFNGNLNPSTPTTRLQGSLTFSTAWPMRPSRKRLLHEIKFSHTIAMSLEHQSLFPRMGFGTVPLLNNEFLTPSHPEMKTQGDLKVSVKEIDDLRRAAVRLSPNGRVSATASYLSRKL